jgi:hypothetical protein
MKGLSMSRRLVALIFTALMVPASANAASTFATWGPHVGFTTDPSQVVFGGQLEMGNVAPQIDFVPSVDFGFGDNVTLVSLNGDFRYRFAVTGSAWQPYAGAGVSLHFLSWDSNVIGHSSSDTQGGGSLLFGADVPTKTGNRFFVEGKFALGDGPTFKATAGWNFKMR